MFERDVLTHLVSEAPAEVVVTEELHCFGLGESTIADRLGELMQSGRTPAIGTGVSEGIITVRITDRGPPDQVRRTIEAATSQVRARLGDLIFGDGLHRRKLHRRTHRPAAYRHTGQQRLLPGQRRSLFQSGQVRCSGRRPRPDRQPRGGQCPGGSGHGRPGPR